MTLKIMTKSGRTIDIAEFVEISYYLNERRSISKENFSQLHLSDSTTFNFIGTNCASLKGAEMESIILIG